MGKFKDGDKVVFIEEHHSPDYIRNYIPSRGSIGVIQSFSELYNEYIVLFENFNSTTFCYEDEIELIKPKEPIITMGDGGVRIKATMKDGLRITDLYPNTIKTKYYDRYVKGEWKNMENEVLELWYTRKHNKIMKEYEEKGREFNNSKELVIKYKEIVERFENELEELYKSEENVEKVYITDELTESLYKYKINYNKLSDEFVDEYMSERGNKLHELDELRKEINAQLSLSTDSEYQIDVLIRYGILDKKTKKMVD